MKTVHITIDSRDTKKTAITIADETFRETVNNAESPIHSQVILPMLEQLLQKYDKTVSDIADITVPVDHGSFTGRRVGAAIAQTLGFLLHIPVNGKSSQELLDIPYEEDKWK